MRNMKRTLSLALALVMVAAFMVVPAFAAEGDFSNVSANELEISFTLDTDDGDMDVYVADGMTAADIITSTKVTVTGSPTLVNSTIEAPADGSYYLIAFRAGNTTTLRGVTTVAIAVVEEYDISFNTNGGTPATIPPQTTVNKKLDSLPAGPTKDGSYFDGWYDGSTEVTTNTVFSADTAVDAKWSPIPTYDLIFKDEDVILLTETKEENTTYTIPGLPIGYTYPEGKDFGGWLVGTMPYKAGQEIDVTADMTFTVNWVDAKGWEPNIEENDADPIEVPHDGGTTLKDLVFDLTNETFVNEVPAPTATDPDATETVFAFEGYSINGGAKWIKGSTIKDKDFASLLKKGGALWLADKLDSKGKGPLAADATATPPVEAAKVVKFTAIEAAPKAPKLIVNYAVKPDITYETAGKWMLTDSKEATTNSAILGDLLISWADAKGKEPVAIGEEDDAFTFGKFPVNGIEIKETAAADKVGKQMYLVKLTATFKDNKYTPGSGTAKVKVSDQIKAPKLKPDYKKELFKGKAGVYVEYASKTSLGDVSGSLLFTKENAKEGFTADFVKALNNQATIYAWTAATAKKPASAAQVIKLAPRAVFAEEIIAPATKTSLPGASFTKGKVVLADKKLYEFWDAGKNKWGGFPKLTAAGKVEARIKNTAKVTKTDPFFDGTAASDKLEFIVEWGAYDTAKPDKQGVLNVYRAP